MSKKKLFSSFSVPLEEADMPHFEINGTCRLLADGCVGILHYDESKIALNCEKLVLEIQGEQLSLSFLGDSEAQVTGQIKTVKLT